MKFYFYVLVLGLMLTGANLAKAEEMKEAADAAMADVKAAAADVAVATEEAMVYCPICKAKHKDGELSVSVDYNGKTYKFCNQKCADEFNKDPEAYIKAQAEGAESAMEEKAEGAMKDMEEGAMKAMEQAAPAAEETK